MISENWKSLALQDKCNIEIFLSPDVGQNRPDMDPNCLTKYEGIHELIFKEVDFEKYRQTLRQILKNTQ